MAARGARAALQRLSAQVVPVQLDHVESKEECGLAIAPMPYQLEQRDALLPARHRLTVVTLMTTSAITAIATSISACIL